MHPPVCTSGELLHCAPPGWVLDLISTANQRMHIVVKDIPLTCTNDAMSVVALFTWHCFPLWELALRKNDNPLTNCEVTAIETYPLLCEVYDILDDIPSARREANHIPNQANPLWRFWFLSNEGAKTAKRLCAPPYSRRIHFTRVGDNFAGTVYRHLISFQRHFIQRQCTVKPRLRYFTWLFYCSTYSTEQMKDSLSTMKTMKDANIAISTPHLRIPSSSCEWCSTSTREGAELISFTVGVQDIDMAQYKATINHVTNCSIKQHRKTF